MTNNRPDRAPWVNDLNEEQREALWYLEENVIDHDFHGPEKGWVDLKVKECVRPDPIDTNEALTQIRKLTHDIRHIQGMVLQALPYHRFMFVGKHEIRTSPVSPMFEAEVEFDMCTGYGTFLELCKTLERVALGDIGWVMSDYAIPLMEGIDCSSFSVPNRWHSSQFPLEIHGITDSFCWIESDPNMISGHSKMPWHKHIKKLRLTTETLDDFIFFLDNSSIVGPLIEVVAIISAIDVIDPNPEEIGRARKQILEHPKCTSMDPDALRIGY